MKVTFQTRQLAAALNKVLPVIPSKATKPILFSVLIEITPDGKATINATNLENYLSVSIPCEQDNGGGRMLILASRLNDILRVCRSETIVFEPSKNGVEIRGDASRWKITTEKPDEFPKQQGGFKGEKLTIPAGRLREMVRRAVFAVGQDNPSNPALGGIFLESADDYLFTVGLDGHHASVTVGEATGATASGVVPLAVAKLVERIMPEDGDCIIQISENSVTFSGDDFCLIGRLLEGRFPKWRSVLPELDDAIFSIDAHDFLATVQEASIATNMETMGVDISVADGRLKVDGQASEIGDAESEFAVEYDGEPLKAMLNHSLLSSFLKVVGGDLVEVRQIHPEAAFYAQAGDTRYVLMPLEQK